MGFLSGRAMAEVFLVLLLAGLLLAGHARGQSGPSEGSSRTPATSASQAGQVASPGPQDALPPAPASSHPLEHGWPLFLGVFAVFVSLASVVFTVQVVDKATATARRSSMPEGSADWIDLKRRLASLERAAARGAEHEEHRQDLRNLEARITELERRATGPCDGKALELALERLNENLCQNPRVEFFASGLRHFAEQLEEQFRFQDPRTRAEHGALEVLRTAQRQIKSFTTRSTEALGRFHDLLTQGSTSSQADEAVWNLHVVPCLNLLRECAVGIDRLALTHGDSPTVKVELVQDFGPYLEDVLRDRSRLAEVTADEAFAFASLVDDYSREVSRHASSRLHAILADAERAQERGGKVMKDVRRYLAQDLLRLYDHLLDLSMTVHQAHPGPATAFNTTVDEVVANLEATLESLGVRRMPVVPHRDQARSDAHQVVHYDGLGKTIVHVALHGFTWEGETLRKAEVWVE